MNSAKTERLLNIPFTIVIVPHFELKKDPIYLIWARLGFGNSQFPMSIFVTYLRRIETIESILVAPRADFAN